MARSSSASMRSTISSRLVPSLLGPICAAATLTWRAMASLLGSGSGDVGCHTPPAADPQDYAGLLAPQARPAILQHLDEHGARLAGGRHLAGEADPAALEALVGPYAELEAKTVDPDHLGRARLDAPERTRVQDQRIGVIAIHVLDDAAGDVRQRVWPGGLVALDGQPVHRPEAADEVDVGEIEPPEREVAEIDPVHRVRVTRAGASGSSPSPGWTTRRLARGSASRFWVCMARPLMSTSGRPRSSGAYG